MHCHARKILCVASTFNNVNFKTNLKIVSNTRLVQFVHPCSTATEQVFKEPHHAEKKTRKSETPKNTVSEEEISKFSKMAEYWWDTNGICKPLHSMNDLRVPLVRDGLIQTGVANPDYVNGPKPLQGLKILDVGCGGGILCEPLARLGAQVTGLDASEEHINMAKAHSSNDPTVSKNISYICSSAEDHLDQIEEEYDAVVASEVIEHVTDPYYFIDTCCALVKPNGSIFITTINKTQASWLGAIVAAEYILNLVPQGTHDWEKFIPSDMLHKMIESNLFHVRLVHGMCYLPILDKWTWSTNKSVNYAVHAVKDLEI